ncbi:MAG: hypothetical protein IPN29_06705 [Saprospiraceae bacterium]|nr:hypothetical protein [Saprospiraceae bacterium]
MSTASFVMGFMLKHCGGVFLDDIFDGDFHDGIVARESQKGGLLGIYTSDISDQVHMGAVANPTVMDKVNEMLNEPITSTHFSSSYGSVSLSYTFNAPCLPFRGREKVDDRITADVEFITPNSGTSANGGDSLTIQYSYSMVDSILVTLATHPDSLSVMFTIANGDSLRFPTPTRLYGPHTLVLLGLDADGSILDQDSVTLNFGTSAEFDSILTTPGSIYLNQHDSMEFSIQGIFSDGVVRDLMLEDSLNFDFDFNRASRRSTHFIRMDSLASDTLVVSKNGAQSKKVIIHKSGTNYPANCKTVTNTLPDGNGSLKQALACAGEGDTITFSAVIALDTIEVDTHGLIIDKNIYLINENAGKMYIRSAAPAIFNTFAGYDITLENLGIVSEHANAVVITNFGNLTLKNVDCRNLSSGIPAKLLNNDSGQVTMLGDVKF